MEFDTYSKTGATRLAAKILNYWALAGLNGVKAWAEPLRLSKEDSDSVVWIVRSNITDLIGVKSFS